MTGRPITQWAVQNLVQVKAREFNSNPYAALISIPVFLSSQQSFNSIAKGLMIQRRKFG